MTEVSWFSVPGHTTAWITYTCGDYIRRWRLHTRLCRDLFTASRSWTNSPDLHPQLHTTETILLSPSVTSWHLPHQIEASFEFRVLRTLWLISAGASPPPYFNEILSDEIICDDEVFTTFRWSPALQGLLVCRLPTYSQKGGSVPKMHFGTVYCIKSTIFCQYIFPFLLIFSENVMTVIHKIQQFFLKK